MTQYSFALCTSMVLTASFLLTGCDRPEAAFPMESYTEQSQPEAPQPPTVQSTASSRFPVQTCINLANALEAPKEGEWGYTIREQDLATIASAGFDTIRLPVRWDVHMSSRAPYTVNAAHMSRVKEVVAQATDLGLNVVLNVHHYEPFMDNPRGEMKRFLALWEQISTEFADAPPSVIFEIMNEPTDKVSMPMVNEMNAKALAVIRKKHPQRWVVIGSNRWNSVDTLGELAVPNDPYIAATYHDYGPFDFTHQGAWWVNMDLPTGKKFGGRKHEEEFKMTFDAAASFARTHDVPIFIGEYGVINLADRKERMKWMSARRTAMERAGYSHCIFDFAGAYALYDFERGQFLPGTKEALGLD